MAEKYRFCEDCSEYVGKWSETVKVKNCPNSICNSTSLQGAFFEFNTPALIKDFFEQRNLRDLILEHKNLNASVPVGYVNDVCFGSKFKNWKKEVIKEDFDLCLISNIDGTPIAESSKSNIWLVQSQIANIPVNKRRGFQLVNGIYYSRCKKPSMKFFLRPFVETMKSLFTDGINWFDKNENKQRHSIVIAPISSCDAPARAEVQCL